MKGPLLYLFDFFMGRESGIFVVLSFFSTFVVLFLCFPLRAYCRGFVAKKLGDDSAESMGMLTLNPLAHIDPLGALCMCICCIGWSKPMPVNPARCHKVSQQKAVTLISLTGPVSLVVLGYLMMLVGKLIVVAAPTSEAVIWIYTGLVYAAQISVFLAVLNILPVPGFDGYGIIQGFLPRRATYWVETHAQIINFIVLILLVSRVLNKPLSLLADAVMRFLNFATGFIG